VNLIGVHCMHIWNYHKETPLYNHICYMLIKWKKIEKTYASNKLKIFKWKKNPNYLVAGFGLLKESVANGRTVCGGEMEARRPQAAPRILSTRLSLPTARAPLAAPGPLSKLGGYAVLVARSGSRVTMLCAGRESDSADHLLSTCSAGPPSDLPPFSLLGHLLWEADKVSWLCFLYCPLEQLPAGHPWPTWE
jgi:hypothetical protein